MVFGSLLLPLSFAGLAFGAFFFAVALWRRETGPRNHGLELPGAAIPVPIRELV